MAPTLLLPRRSIAGRRVSGLAVSIGVHALGVLLLTWRVALPFASGATQAQAPAATTTTAASVESPDDAGMQDDDRAVGDDRDTIDALPEETVTAAGVTINIAKIRARQETLFPFLTADLSFVDRETPASQSTQSRLISPFASQPETRAADGLAMSDEQLQAVVDRAWTRRDRWRVFSEIAGLVRDFAGDEGRVAEVLQQYLDQNILQPFCDRSVTDPRFWAMLENASDHIDFLGFVRDYVREHPSSRTTTELLFLLDELAQASQQALILLLNTDPLDLQTTRADNPEGFALAEDLRERYMNRLSDLDMQRPGAIRAHYDAIRLRLLSAIVDTSPGGYRAADARFLAGEILLNEGEAGAALAWWRPMVPQLTDSYRTEALRLVDALRRSDGPDVRDIRRIFDSSFGRWRASSLARLAQFGYTCDSF